MRGHPQASFPKSHNHLLVAQGALRIDIVTVIARRRFDLPGRIVADQAILPAFNIVRDRRRQANEPGDRLGPTHWRVAESALTGQMAFRSIVAVLAGVLWARLAVGVAASAGSGLVIAHQRDRVIGQVGLLEGGRCVAALAARVVVVVVGRLVAVGTFCANHLGKVTIQMAIGTCCLRVPARQIHRVRDHLYHLPIFG